MFLVSSWILSWIGTGTGHRFGVQVPPMVRWPTQAAWVVIVQMSIAGSQQTPVGGCGHGTEPSPKIVQAPVQPVARVAAQEPSA